MPKSHPPAAGAPASARGSARTEDGSGSPVLPPLVPTSATTAGSGGGISVSSAAPERREDASSAEPSASPPTTTLTRDGGGDNGTVINHADESTAPAATRGGRATCGLTLPADGSGRAGRDYGPGIPITRVSSWSALGDEGGGVVFAGNAEVGGSGTGSQPAAAEREDAPPPASTGLRPALLLTGERERRRLEDVSAAGSQSSPASGRTA